MSRKKSIKRSISLRSDVFQIAEQEVDKYFGGNFSAYITYLICSDKHGAQRGAGEEEVVSAKTVVENVNNYEKSDDNDKFINSLINM